MVNSDARWVRWLTVAVSLLAGAALWEFGTRGMSPALVSPFSATLLRLVEMIQTGELSSGVLGSLALFLTGLGLAVATALPLGLLLARARRIRIALSDYIMLMNATPLVALIPLILSIAGLDFPAKVLVVFLFSFFPILFNTIEGARSIKPELIEVARSFRSTEWAIWRDIMVPGTLPYAMTGIRQAIGRALVGMIAAEFFLSASGLGQLIMTSARNFDTAALFGTVLIISLLGAALSGVGRALENRFTPWRTLGR
jgi:ABC-type nitrate/sulfonate/bicarbonate transport system permease component